MATKADIRQRVGEDLGLVPMGQALESQHATRIDTAYDEVYARLKEEGLATWASTGSVPDKLVPYVALLIEEKLLISYSVPDARYQRIKAEAGQDGEDAILALAALAKPEHESMDGVEDF